MFDSSYSTHIKRMRKMNALESDKWFDCYNILYLRAFMHNSRGQIAGLESGLVLVIFIFGEFWAETYVKDGMFRWYHISNMTKFPYSIVYYLLNKYNNGTSYKWK